MEHEYSNSERTSFIIAAYKRCFDSKHHYDSLSWAIGGILLVFVGALFAYIPQLKGEIYLIIVGKRLIIAFFSWILLYLWYRIYERNRFWAEVSNEQIRDFERLFKVEGIGIRFMKTNKNKYIILKNIDENSIPIDQEKTENLKHESIHNVIPNFLFVIGVAILFACLIPR